MKLGQLRSVTDSEIEEEFPEEIEEIEEIEELGDAQGEPEETYEGDPDGAYEGEPEGDFEDVPQEGGEAGDETTGAAPAGVRYAPVYDGPQEAPKKKKSAIRLPLILIAVLVLLLAIAFGGFKLYDVYTEKQNQIASLEEQVASKEASLAEEQKQKAELEVRLANEFSQGVNNGEEKVLNRIRQSIQSGTSVVETLRALYPDQLVVASGGTYHFIPINNALKRNSYSAENLVKQANGEMQYVQSGEVTSYKGIDVSKFQGTIDWKKVAADGVSFAYIRVGYRGYGENGTLVEDPCAKDNLKGANNAGIATGVYFYTQATTIEEAKEEVRMVTDIIRGYRIDCPIVVDVERVSSASARMNQLDVKLRTDVVKAFCDEVIKAGYRPMIYHNLEMGAVLLDISKLEEYDKWFAYYNGDLYYPYDYKVLQYSDKGRVSGITGDVDLNIAFEPIWKSE